MPQTRIETTGHEAPRARILGSAVRTLTLVLATLATGLVAGVFYAYAISVNLGLAVQPDASYVDTMQAINARIQNPMFFAELLRRRRCSCSRRSPPTSCGPGRAVFGSSRWPARSTSGAASY